MFPIPQFRPFSSVSVSRLGTVEGVNGGFCYLIWRRDRMGKVVIRLGLWVFACFVVLSVVVYAGRVCSRCGKENTLVTAGEQCGLLIPEQDPNHPGVYYNVYHTGEWLETVKYNTCQLGAGICNETTEDFYPKCVVLIGSTNMLLYPIKHTVVGVCHK